MPDESNLVVCDTTIIVALALIGHLGLLHKLYGEVWIPPTVAEEVVVIGSTIRTVKPLTTSYMRTVPLTITPDSLLRGELQRGEIEQGEVEVLTLAQEHNADLVLMDGLGYRCARWFGLYRKGTLGVLADAKNYGYISRCCSAGVLLADGVN